MSEIDGDSSLTEDDKLSIREHNQRQTDALERYVTDVEWAKKLLKHAEYKVFTKREFDSFRNRVWKYTLCAVFFAALTGFSLAMLLRNTGWNFP
jgi:hypothetical protein